MDALRRFWNKVNKTDNCWNWIGGKTVAGYGCFKLDGRNYLTHRLVYAWTYGPFAKGLNVCHKCDNPSCVRPDHLFLGTYSENMQDASRKGRLSNLNHASGEKVGTSILTVLQVKDIRHIYQEGIKISEIAKRYKVGESTVRHIIKGRTWVQV